MVTKIAIFVTALTLTIAFISCTTSPTVSTPEAKSVPVSATETTPAPKPVEEQTVNPPVPESESAVSIWLSLINDLSDLIGRMDNDAVDEIEAEEELQALLNRTEQTLKLIDKGASLDKGSFDRAEFKSMVEETELVVQTYLQALENADEELTDTARNLFEEVVDYATNLLDKVGTSKS